MITRAKVRTVFNVLNDGRQWQADCGQLKNLDYLFLIKLYNLRFSIKFERFYNFFIKSRLD